MGEGCFLIVEDEGTIARCLARLIRPYGAAVPVTTRREATTLLAQDVEWSGIIIDYQLPDGSGLDVLAQARGRLPRVPAMVLTGHNDDVVANAAYDFDADYVVKPVEGARIARFLRRATAAPPAGMAWATRIDSIVEAAISACKLSGAEGDVLLRAARGESRNEIARARGSSSQTINKHVTNMLRRMGDLSLRDAVERLRQEAAGVSVP